jgi:hypothetical protein
MPTLLDLQRAMHGALLGNIDVSALLAEGIALDRLDIYRNTLMSGLTKTLLLGYPAVARLVGADFFDGAAYRFIAEHPPQVAYLDAYGGDFPDFLRCFATAASLAYLADVARLESAVNRAIHAPDVEPLDLTALGAIDPAEQVRVRFVAHPSISVLRADYPADTIWRAVLTGNDETLTSLDLDSGTVYLLVERRTSGVEVVRLTQPAWRFLADLCAGQPIGAAIDPACDFDFTIALAEHLRASRFVAFDTTRQEFVPSLRVADAT